MATVSSAAIETGDSDLRTRRRENLKRALRARHIVFVGGRPIEDSIRVCERAGFEGEIWPVHPTYESLAGHPCYRSIADLPQAPDAALLAVSRERTVDMVRELARIGAGAAISITGGFAESDATGIALQQGLREAAGELALVGPNCLGIMNQFDGVAIWGGDNAFRPVAEPGVALISQSGYVAYSITNVEQAFPLGYAISIGNQAVLDVSDYMDSVLDDRRVSAIGLYLEGLVDVAALSRTALRALEMGVPVVALKTGGTEAGAELTTSHSGTLAVADDLWRALFDRLGMVEVFSPKTLVETLKLVGLKKRSEDPGLGGRGIVAAANSGGYCALVGEKGRRLGLEFPVPTDTQRTALRRHVPDLVSLLNPLDYNLPWASLSNPNTADTGLGCLMDERCNLLVYFIDYPIAKTVAEVWRPTIDGLIQLHARKHIPVVVASVLPDGLPVDLRIELQAAGLPALQGLDETMAAIAAAADYGERRGAILGEQNPIGARTLPDAGPPVTCTRMLDEKNAKELLHTYGLPFPEGHACNATDAADIAAKIGFPVALKLLNADLAHKNRAGALRLNLQSAADMEDAVRAIQTSVTAYDARLFTDRFLVERMVPRARAEFLAGVKNQPGIGLALIVGAGGVEVEMLRDFRTLLLPSTRGQIAEALSALTIVRRLKLDETLLREIVEAMFTIACFAEDHRGALAELDVNPLILCENGEVFAVDALIRMGTKSKVT
jgi:acyl-CoA synthetase (NDP forming)